MRLTLARHLRLPGGDRERLFWIGDIARRALVESGPQARAINELLCRTLDIVVASIALLIFAPFMALTALLIAFERKGPIFFAHTRIGRGGAPFQVLKFRTMCVNGDEVLAAHLQADEAARLEWEEARKLRKDPRVSALGHILRSSSIDELPQLFNVLKGEMSIVGPRPIVEAEVSRYGEFFNAYCSICPGITGVWQVSGRNDISYHAVWKWMPSTHGANR